MKKLVRDKYAFIIHPDQLSIATDEEVVPLLLEKFQEELKEIVDSGFTDILEYGDLFEVMIKLAAVHGFTKNDILRARNMKKLQKGSFKTNLVWSGVYND